MALWPSFSKKRKTIRGTGDLGLPQHTANSQRLSHVHTAVVHLVGLCKSHLSVLFTPDMPSNGLMGSARLGCCGLAMPKAHDVGLVDSLPLQLLHYDLGLGLFSFR